METFFAAFGFAFGAVVLAEMGDKTQLLAMAFAAKYKARKVMAGVFIATVLNHALAVALGHFVGRFEPVQPVIQGLASASFIFFGLWTLKGDKLAGEENRATRFGATVTVAVAFFLAEMGDKTQLATVALAAKFPASPAGVLAGTTAGMLAADGFGIVVGHMLQKRIPERAIKFACAAAFVLFGLLGTGKAIASVFSLPLAHNIVIMALVTIATGVVGFMLIRKGNRS